jgi:hypothetical protein
MAVMLLVAASAALQGSNCRQLMDAAGAAGVELQQIAAASCCWLQDDAGALLQLAAVAVLLHYLASFYQLCYCLHARQTLKRSHSVLAAAGNGVARLLLVLHHHCPCAACSAGHGPDYPAAQVAASFHAALTRVRITEVVQRQQYCTMMRLLIADLYS